MVGSKTVLTSFYLYSFRTACQTFPMFYNILILFKMYNNYNYLGVRMVKLFQLEQFDFHFKVDNFEVTCVAQVGLKKTMNIFNKFLLGRFYLFNHLLLKCTVALFLPNGKEIFECIV